MSLGARTPLAAETSGASIHRAGFGRRSKGFSGGSSSYAAGRIGGGGGFGASACLAIIASTSSTIIFATVLSVQAAPKSSSYVFDGARGALRLEPPIPGVSRASGIKTPSLSRRQPSHTIVRWYTPLRFFGAERAIAGAGRATGSRTHGRIQRGSARRLPIVLATRIGCCLARRALRAVVRVTEAPTRVRGGARGGASVRRARETLAAARRLSGTPRCPKDARVEVRARSRTSRFWARRDNIPQRKQSGTSVNAFS